MTPEPVPYAPVPLPLGAMAVSTEPFMAVQQFGHQVLTIGGILLIAGPPGTGKTYAADSLCAGLSVPVVKLHLADRARGHDVLRDLLDGLGLASDAKGRVLLQEARNALLRRRLLIYVDEAHLLNREALRQIRWLFDQRGMQFALVLTGVDFSEAFASAPELDSRVARRVRFTKLGGATLVPTLKSFHPILAATGDELLREINRRYCVGIWRHWNTMLVAASGYGATPATGITPDIAAAALAAISGEG